MKARGQEVNPVSGAALDALIAELYATPKDVVEETRRAIGGTDQSCSSISTGSDRLISALRRVGALRFGFISSPHGLHGRDDVLIAGAAARFDDSTSSSSSSPMSGFFSSAFTASIRKPGVQKPHCSP